MRLFLLGTENDSFRSAYIWNTVGGMLFAGQSAFLLIVISHTNPVEDAGIFSIAFAIANLALAVGKYGMRPFQASDAGEKYSFYDYLVSRRVTDFGMLLVTAYYMLKGFFALSYGAEKLAAVALMAILKLTDAVEDVYHGRLQQTGRLDVAGKCLSFRYILVLVVMFVLLPITRNLLVVIVAGCVVSWGFFFYSCTVFSGLLGKPVDSSDGRGKIYFLLKDCFALAAGGFLMMYIANSPKYAIDAYMDGATQACFNYIFMPVYVVSVLSTFVFQPLIAGMAGLLETGNKIAVWKLFMKINGLVFLICAAVMTGGALLGIPVLSVLFNAGLSTYQYSFLVLLAGGCMLAYASFFSVCVTIFRKQGWLLIGYVVPALVELFFCKGIVQRRGVAGAAELYAALMLFQALCFLGIFLTAYIKYEKTEGKADE